MRFKITPPTNPVVPEEVRQKNKRMFSEDFDKSGILTKSMVFTKLNEPVAKGDLKLALQEYYHVEFDKSAIGRALKRINELGLLQSITSGELTTMPQNEMTEMHRKAYKKFFQFLQHIPKQFRRNYDAVTYYWVSNGEGNLYLEWCCKLLGFDYKEEK